MKYKIALLPGDGIGPEIVEQCVKILAAIEEKSDLSFELNELLIGAASIDETGSPLTDETIEGCMASDAILFGAIGDPKYDNNPSSDVRPEQGLLALRKALALFANVRPVESYPFLENESPLKNDRISGADMVFYRELTGGIYFGDKEEGLDYAFDTCEYSRTEVERLLKLAFEAAENRKGKLTVVDKANVMASSRLWRAVAKDMALDYPDVELDFLFVDNAAMQLILNPKQFDVIATSNMFGDILSDEASVIAGSLGMLASSSLGEHTALFEPIHGSFPEAKGKNIANPIGSILSMAMMFDHLKQHEIAEMIRATVQQSFEQGVVTQDLNADDHFTTSEVGSYIALDVSKRLEEKLATVATH